MADKKKKNDDKENVVKSIDVLTKAVANIIIWE